MKEGVSNENMDGSRNTGNSREISNNKNGRHNQLSSENNVEQERKKFSRNGEAETTENESRSGYNIKSDIGRRFARSNSNEVEGNWNERRRSNNDTKSASKGNRGAMLEDVRMDRQQSGERPYRNERNGKTNSETISTERKKVKK
ncbi:MAG: hypothetical protein IKP28_06195 [Clostridia bacterium]|nr:hypothetical protein [Clostridia bacterium]